MRAGIGRTAIGTAALALTGASPPPQQQPAPSCNDGVSRWITLRNLTPNTILYLQERQPGTQEWSKDKLGDVALPPGAQVRVAMSRAQCRCSSDVRIQYEGNRRPERVAWNFYYCGGNRTLDAS